MCWWQTQQRAPVLSAESLDELHKAGDPYDPALQGPDVAPSSVADFVASFASHMLDDDDEPTEVYRQRKRKQPGRKYECRKRVQLSQQPLRPQDRQRLLATDRLVEGLERCQCSDINCVEGVTIADYRDAIKRNLNMTRPELRQSICEELRGFARSG